MSVASVTGGRYMLTNGELRVAMLRLLVLKANRTEIRLYVVFALLRPCRNSRPS